MSSSALRRDSLAVHAGRGDLRTLGVHAAPIDLSSTNPVPDLDAGGLSYEAMAAGGHPVAEGGAVYARLWNPTVARFEDALARLEGTQEAVAFASGMAAMTAAVLAAAQPSRRHVVAVGPLYGGTDHLLRSNMVNAEVTFCAADEVRSAVRQDTCLVVIETPANPTLDLVDIAAVAGAAGGRPVVVDNTFATPILQNPADWGADMVLHSATKYLGGHGDVVGGAVATNTGWAAALRRVRATTGGILHPLAGYLLHRGLATLPLRVRAQQDSAGKLATWLSAHPAIRRVHYPGLPECDPEGLVPKQMRGPGAMISIQLAGGFAQAARLVSSVRLFEHAVSLGGVTSLIQHPASLTHRPVPADARPGADIVRLSIGLEDPKTSKPTWPRRYPPAANHPPGTISALRRPAPVLGAGHRRSEDGLLKGSGATLCVHRARGGVSDGRAWRGDRSGRKPQSPAGVARGSRAGDRRAEGRVRAGHAGQGRVRPAGGQGVRGADLCGPGRPHR